MAEVVNDFWNLLSTLKNVKEKQDDVKKEDKKEVIKFNKDVCENPACKQAADFVMDDGQYICQKCNSIQSRFIDGSAEWRSFADDRGVERSRCGLPTNDLLPKSSLGSMIGSSFHETWDQRKIRTYQMWNSMPYKERSLYNIFDQITLSSAQHNLTPKIINDAKVLYKKVSECKISRGENREGLIASSIYLSCIMNKSPRSPKEVARIFEIDSTLLTKGISRYQNLLKINIACTTPEDYIVRFGSILNMNAQHIDYCKIIVNRVLSMNIISENAPTSIAAGTIYLCIIICKLPITKKEIHLSTDISEVTITKCYKKMLPFADELFTNLSTLPGQK